MLPQRYRFKSYRSASGEDRVRHWYERQIKVSQSELTIIAMYLRDQHADAWVRPDYADLAGSLSGIGELRAIIGDVHFRILGFRDDESFEFTMLHGVRKKKKFDYKDIQGLVQRRKGDVMRDAAKFTQPADWLFLTS